MIDKDVEEILITTRYYFKAILFKHPHHRLDIPALVNSDLRHSNRMASMYGVGGG